MMRFKRSRPAKVTDASTPAGLASLERTGRRREKVNTRVRDRYRTFEKVTSIEQLARLASEKRSVFCNGCWGLLPASVVMNMVASQVHRAITNGIVYIYPKPL